MKRTQQFAYLGARFEDPTDPQDPPQQPPQIDVNQILGNQDLLRQVLEKAPQFQQAQQQAQSAAERLQQLETEKREIEAKAQEQKFKSETLREVFGDATDPAEAYKKADEYFRTRYEGQWQQKDQTIDTLTQERDSLKQEIQTAQKRDFFLSQARGHKGLHEGAEQRLFQDVKNMIQLDANGNAQYVDDKGIPLLGSDGKNISTEEMLDTLREKPDFRFFFKNAESTGGLGGAGNSPGTQRMSRRELTNLVAKSSPKEQAEIVRKIKAEEIKVYD